MNFYYWLGYHFSRLAGRLFFRFRVIHRERMIHKGPVILAMNHESYLDPLLAGTTCDRAIYFLTRRTLLDTPLLGWLLPKLNVIPVNQEGVDRSASLGVTGAECGDSSQLAAARPHPASGAIQSSGSAIAALRV